MKGDSLRNYEDGGNLSIAPSGTVPESSLFDKFLHQNCFRGLKQRPCMHIAGFLHA